MERFTIERIVGDIALEIFFSTIIIIIIIIMQIYIAHRMKFLAYNSWIWGALNSGYKCQPNAQPK